MADKEKYYIAIEGQLLEVNKEIYEVYYKGKRKEQYFEQDLKIEHTKINKERASWDKDKFFLNSRIRLFSICATSFHVSFLHKYLK